MIFLFIDKKKAWCGIYKYYNTCKSKQWEYTSFQMAERNSVVIERSLEEPVQPRRPASLHGMYPPSLDSGLCINDFIELLQNELTRPLYMLYK